MQTPVCWKKSQVVGDVIVVVVVVDEEMRESKRARMEMECKLMSEVLAVSTEG
jgi:hypothetical protein